MHTTVAATIAGLCMLPWVARAGDRTAAAYQVTPAHNAAVTYAKTWGPALKVLWTAPLDGAASFPMYAGGQVFALVAGSPEELVTIDASTGQVTSKLSAGTTSSQGLAYDDGKLFSVDSSGILSAFSVAKRKALWAQQMPGQYAFSSAPSALNGIVYVGGAGEGGTLYAAEEKTGKLLWTQSVENGDDSSPAVTNQGVYVSYPCQYYDFAPKTGVQIWHYDGGCDGGGGNTVVIGGGYAFIRDWTGPEIILDAARGTTVGTFSASAPPVVAGPGLAYYLDNGTLAAIGPKTSQLFWEFKGDGTLETPPVAVNKWVVAASNGGNIYVLDSTTGAVAFTTKFTGTLNGTPGAGGNMILLPIGNTLVALGSTT